jgi:hypothetical protein
MRKPIVAATKDRFMFAENWSRVVVASVAPVVVISASGLLCLAFYNRLAAIVSRLRSVQRERLAEQLIYNAAVKRPDAEAIDSHGRLLANLGHQTARIIARARLIRLTLLFLLTAVAFMVVSSLLNGVALFWPAAAIAAACAFGGGMLSLLSGVIIAMRELGAALDVVELESELVSELTDYDGTESDSVSDDAVNANSSHAGKSFSLGA